MLLDQFLEGILNSPLYKNKDTDEIKLVRIGGRSQSERVSKFSLNNKRTNTFLPGHVHQEKFNAEDKVREFTEFRCSRMQEYFNIMNSRKTLPLEKLTACNVILPEHYSMLYYYAQTPEQATYALEIWLGLVQVVNQFSGIPEAISKKGTSSSIGSVADGEDTHYKEDALPSPEKQNEGQHKEPANNQGSESTPISTKESKEEESASNDEDDESDSESLIEVTGEAVIEQSYRIMDDYQQPLRSISVSKQEADIEEYYHRMESATYSPYGDDCVAVTPPEVQQQMPETYFDRERANQILLHGFSLQPMSEDEVFSVHDVHALSFDDRWRLYLYWHSQFLSILCAECEKDFQEYNRLCSLQDEARKKADRFSLESAEIIGMTTTGAAKYQHVLHLVKPRIVIVEEAAEVLESHIVSALNAGTQHLILIGDHKQLRPKPNEYELAKKYNLDISLFERLIHNGFPHATLEYQHRMRPEIAELVKPHIYTVLSNHPHVQDYPDVRGVSTNLYFINHESEEKEDENLMSHSNAHEAIYLVSLCRYLLRRRYTPEQITILVTYSGQLLAMRRLMPKSEFNGVRICTVDNFQGKENDIILLSLVRSNSERNVGFLREENRVCVALSRAKQGFYCIGNFNMLREQVPLWESIMTDMEEKSKLGESLLLHCSNHPENNFRAKSGKDFEVNSPKGGCLLDCTYRLECGHVCAQKCHYTDPEHKDYKCKEKCTKSCPEGHPCRSLCFQLCKCKVRVTRKMPDCDHLQEMFCHEDLAKVKCTNPCKRKCDKNIHACPLLCYQTCQNCMVKVSIIMPSCQHEQRVECYRDLSSVKCIAECSLQCKSGHKCPKLCFEDCGDCLVKTKKSIPECGHEVWLPCYVEPKHSECTMPCEKILPCDHKCSLKCGETCSPSLCTYTVAKELPDCGHIAKIQCNMSRLKIQCTKPCERLLPCGHPCGLECSKPCETKCTCIVNKVWPCGHKLKRPCYQTESPEEHPCNKKCGKILECGHPCSKTCSQPCDEKCQTLVAKTYPCGHMVEAKCSSTTSESPCPRLCSYILACGHKCAGKCSKCTTDHMHKPCQFKIGIKRFCGHSFQTSCRGLADTHPGKKELNVLCHHDLISDKKPERKCSEERLLACYQLCEWRCSHFECSRPCSERCDLSICDECCPLKLKCGHQCYGLCGEPCLSACPDCSLKSFRKKLKGTDHFDKEKHYYELSCKHIFPVHYLDEYVHKLSSPKAHIQVCPIQCPVKECSQPIISSYRYGNQVKQQLLYVQAVNARLTSEGDKDLDIDLYSRVQEIIASDEYVEISRHDMKVLPSKHDWASKDGLFFKFIPMPEISSTLYKLKALKPRRNEEEYLIFLLLEGLDSLIHLRSCSKTFSKVSDYDSIMIEMKRFIRYVDALIIQHDFKVAYQIILDLQSELFRLNLSLYILYVKASPYEISHDEELVLNEVERCVADASSCKLQITESLFLQHIKPLCKILQFKPSNYEDLIGDIDCYYPVFHKGQWWRCPNGHYYCCPVSLLDGIKLKCPYCEGTHRNFIQIPEQNEIRHSLLHQPFIPAASPQDVLAIRDDADTPKEHYGPQFHGGNRGRGMRGGMNRSKRRKK